MVGFCPWRRGFLAPGVQIGLNDQMTLVTLCTSFSRPESEVIVSYLASEGISAVPAERHFATCKGDHLVALQGIHILVSDNSLAKARLLLTRPPAPVELPESRAFARHATANALIFICAFVYLGFGYFPYWIRRQENAAIATDALS